MEGYGCNRICTFDLGRDHISFSNELYRQIFEEAVEHIDDPNFEASRFFLSHPDPQVSKLASELISDRYQLSKIHSKILGEEMDDKNSRLLERNRLNSYVPRATTELKNFYVLQKIKEVKDAMKSGDQNDYVTLINQLQQLQEMKKVLAKELGERIVLKYFN